MKFQRAKTVSDIYKAVYAQLNEILSGLTAEFADIITDSDMGDVPPEMLPAEYRAFIETMVDALDTRKALTESTDAEETSQLLLQLLDLTGQAATAMDMINGDTYADAMAEAEASGKRCGCPACTAARQDLAEDHANRENEEIPEITLFNTKRGGKLS